MQRECNACEGYGGFGRQGLNNTECKACLGLGTVSERIPASDAMADAETLILYADSQSERGAFGLSQSLWSARTLNWLNDIVDGRSVAAHAAFRVVPGLRG